MSSPHPAHVGKYRLVRKIATGGMAEVYLAQAAGPAGFQKTLVLKRILPHLGEDQQFVEMFLNEARLAAVLNHPNIVQIFDLGEAAGSYFIAMEYIDGPNLRGLCRRGLEKGLPMPFEYAAKILSLACEGLHYAHEFTEDGQPLNLIHRDVSPDNILISRSGAVKVVDFGIAKAANQGHLTKTGTLKGKLAYMPPEQLRGKPLDRRADIFALGVVFYELLAGMKPFDATSEVAAMQAILHDPPIPLKMKRPDVPPEILRIITCALEKDRENRYPDCRAMQQDLERFVMRGGTPIGPYELAQLVNEFVPAAPVSPQPTPLPKSVPIEIASLEPLDPAKRKNEAAAAHQPAPAAGTQFGADAATILASHSAGGTLVDPGPPVHVPSRGRGHGLLLGLGVGALVVMAGVAALSLLRSQGPVPMAIPDPAAVAVAPPSADADPGAEPAVPVKPSARVAVPEPVPAEPIVQKDEPPEAQPTPTGPEVAEVPPPDKTPTTRPGRTSSKQAKRPATTTKTEKTTPVVVPAVAAPAPAKQSGTLIIETDPPCQIAIDGKPHGTSPVTVAGLEPGTHDVVISNRDKKLQRRMTLSIGSGETRREKVKFSSGTLVFRVRPWASVEIDGKPYGVTPLAAPVTLFEGEHRVRLYNPDLNKELVRTLWISAGKEEIVKANLEE